MRGTAKVIGLEIEQDELILTVEFVLGEDDAFVREMTFNIQPNIKTVITNTLKSELRRMLQGKVNESDIRRDIVDTVITEQVMEEAEPAQPL